MSLLSECRFASSDVLITKLSDAIAANLNKGLQEKGKASLVVSGGSTPIPLFKALSKMPLDWKNIWITLADERWVSPDHKDSNEALVRRHLLTRRAADAHFVSLWNEAGSPEEGQAESGRALTAMPMPFDAVVLGMGEDAHTASLFPAAQELGEALNAPADVLCLALIPPVAPHPRITLTKAALLSSNEIYLHITGPKKLAVLEAAKSEGAVEEMPIRAFLRQEITPVNVFWTTS